MIGKPYHALLSVAKLRLMRLTQFETYSRWYEYKT